MYTNSNTQQIIYRIATILEKSGNFFLPKYHQGIIREFSFDLQHQGSLKF